MEAIAQPYAVNSFLKRWQGNSGSERSNFQSFMRDLCTLLDLPLPDPGHSDTGQNSYVFERFIASARVDGNTDNRYIDLYRRDCFVLEGKQTGKELASRSHQNAINAAVAQAERYVRGLPQEEVEHGRPPFIVVVDVGNAIYLYSEFTRTGGNYVPFPDPRHYEVRLEDLHKPEIQHRLRQLWLQPEQLDPSKHAAKVTRQVSAKLAALAKSLELNGYDVERVASFLKRCLFTMFAEDVELLPRSSFHDLLVDIKERNPEAFPHALKALWETMNTGGYSERLMQTIKRFNGGLFKDIDPIPLNVQQIQLLIDAAAADWRFVEPAIFGTLLERALDPRERHKLGAHYTPRAYVERLVKPTLIEPLREQWGDIRGAAETLLRQGKTDKALQQVQAFHYQLCETRVLDPACGSANFLYVALEHMKRLEGEVLGFISELTQGQGVLESEGLTVDPHQFLGLEINPRAAQIAELVLWIGYLQWHYRLNDWLDLPEPILRDFKNIECRDALIEYDSREPELNEKGEPVTIWDGISMKVSPTTGELIPDETGRATVYRYHNPRKVQWPKADYIVGNPPFIGEKRMRDALGDGYTHAVRGVYSELPACDFVMYWWHKAAELVADGAVRRFGFITTNSIGQTKSRGVTSRHLDNDAHIRLAIPDHPWVDGNDGAAVRIAMTVVSPGKGAGSRLKVTSEMATADGDARQVTFSATHGVIFADLGVGAALVEAAKLESNDGLVFQGVKLVGDGFLVSPEQRSKWVSERPELRHFLPRLVAGSDLTRRRAPRYCIDFYGYDSESARRAFPSGFQKILSDVKPFRDEVRRKGHREKYWLYGETRPAMRRALHGLRKYIVTSEVSKHRIFTFLDKGEALADGSLAVLAFDNAALFGVLSSRLHVCWALAQGGRMGAGNDSRWQNGPCFLNFPFPEFSDELGDKIRHLANRIDAHRKQQQADYPLLTLTNIYNVLERLNAGEPIHDKPKEKETYEQGLVELLKELHDDLDRAVFEAYGWPDLADKLVGRPGATMPLPNKPAEQAEAEEELLMRLVELNKQRAQEEAQGIVRWLRPEYQAPDAVQQEVDVAPKQAAVKQETAGSKGKVAFPKTIPEQLRVLREALAERAHTTESLSELFKRKPRKSVEEGLQSLAAVGVAEYEPDSDTWHVV
ncbi:hypothetical protein SAMN05216429_10824 [Marinobacter persicus]|uniref:site-specific DNA-methyltransferase (adenine-specific) n=1 Tax=Marinobacter persicus TaxID=930118 RepID=A0A1I3VK61_9GAMM|nr:DNA methyltransferase [Marinobacter persicus]GHD51528.1 hypothetical protein GCM10008110_23350 [Marinobacter persicus]SFJ95449.1 hypothetical protein SAMN05216429_10824 [Marinobacter persicus]